MQCLFQFFEIVLIRLHFLLYIDKFHHHRVLDLKDEMIDIQTKNLLLLCHLYTICKQEQEILNNNYYIFISLCKHSYT